MQFTLNNCTAKFHWNRNRVFDKEIFQVLFEKCKEGKEARVLTTAKKPKTKYRPQPLNTVEAQKLISRKLRISPEQAMQIMEKLYNKGFLSYPRTETTKFNPTINLRTIISSL
jgi:DNA topoisomerase III